ncbi:hypothetical protein [Pectinatus sottacetonis]|uniref:hypothetical protein n=1 Tax=Pectinatus sottacetonis TaxID=1002795 RepID=UPI0018C750DB|nr:hypothetical protein [Pectinatus sottacetonis]
MNDSTLEKKLSAALNTTNTQSDEMYQQVVQHENSRQETISNLVELKDDGLLSEKQKNNAINITNAIALSERARLIGTKLTDNVTAQNAAATISRLDAEKVKAGSIYAYDPYNPSDYDTKNKETTSTNYGFLSFGE